MKRTIIVASTAFALFALAACEEKKSEDPATKSAPATSASAQPAVAQPAAVVINDNDLATAADFEETAEKAISKSNYKQELSTLETDIAKE